MKSSESFEEQVQVLLEERVPVFSFTFGIPSPAVIQAMKQHGIFIIGTATTVDEAKQLEAAGADAIVAQGSEAGGHRGTFLKDASQALIGTMSLPYSKRDDPGHASGGCKIEQPRVYVTLGGPGASVSRRPTCRFNCKTNH